MPPKKKPDKKSAYDTLPQPSCNEQLGALPNDLFHHYYHYQASAQYLWLAETCLTLGAHEDAIFAINKALFQDHFNAAALALKTEISQKNTRSPQAPIYHKHTLTDARFRELVGEPPSEATRLHDKGISAYSAGDFTAALAYFDTATAIEPDHSNSYFSRAKCFFALQRFERAEHDLRKAIRLSHMRHDHYHRSASAAHLTRGYSFLRQGQIDLAIADFSKALDLWHGSTAAFEARAQAYLQKGNETLANEDRRRAKIS